MCITMSLGSFHFAKSLLLLLLLLLHTVSECVSGCVLTQLTVKCMNVEYFSRLQYNFEWFFTLFSMFSFSLILTNFSFYLWVLLTLVQPQKQINFVCNLHKSAMLNRSLLFVVAAIFPFLSHIFFRKSSEWRKQRAICR